MKQGSFNPLQLLFALGAIMAFLFLPVVGFGLTGIFTMGPNGLTLVSHGFDLFWLPLGVYVLMALSSFVCSGSIRFVWSDNRHDWPFCLWAGRRSIFWRCVWRRYETVGMFV